MKYVRVVPVLRTPVGVDVFDYAVPEGMDPHRGDLLSVPFRGRPMPAMAVELMTDSPYAKRASKVSGTYAGIKLGAPIADLLAWTAERTFTSRPAVLKSWLRNLPKRPKAIEAWKPRVALAKGSLRAHWVEQPERPLLERARSLLTRGGRVLILTPWRVRAERLREELRSPSALLHGDLNDGDAFEAWTSFANGSVPCLVGTRLAAWLAPLADAVLIDEPENDDHKQDELAPRYDARLLAAWAAAHAGTDVESFGRTPPLHVRVPAPTIPCPLLVHVRHPSGRSSIPMVQADTLDALREHEGPIVLIHPIRGTASRYVCRDCGWRALCPRCGFGLSAEARLARCRRCGWKGEPPLACGACGGVDLGKALPGIDRLRAAWEKHEPGHAIEWRDLSNEAMDRPFPENALVVLTDASLLGGAVEDVRRRERTAVAFRRLADQVLSAHGTLAIQTQEASLGDWEMWLDGVRFNAFQEEERQQRRLFGYPPMSRIVKILTRDAADLPDLPIARERRGPFPVAHRTVGSAPRYVWHLLCDPSVSEMELIRALSPLAKRAIIDLDPIAFFR